jgi:hypothetical protein
MFQIGRAFAAAEQQHFCVHCYKVFKGSFRFNDEL